MPNGAKAAVVVVVAAVVVAAALVGVERVVYLAEKRTRPGSPEPQSPLPDRWRWLCQPRLM